ncbi:MAG: hypothetical protein QM811_11835 [Pirellulales bacterium]
MWEPRVEAYEAFAQVLLRHPCDELSIGNYRQRLAGFRHRPSPQLDECAEFERRILASGRRLDLIGSHVVDLDIDHAPRLHIEACDGLRDVRIFGQGKHLTVRDCPKLRLVETPAEYLRIERCPDFSVICDVPKLLEFRGGRAEFVRCYGFGDLVLDDDAKLRCLEVVNPTSFDRKPELGAESFHMPTDCGLEQVELHRLPTALIEALIRQTRPFELELILDDDPSWTPQAMARLLSQAPIRSLELRLGSPDLDVAPLLAALERSRGLESLTIHRPQDFLTAPGLDRANPPTWDKTELAKRWIWRTPPSLSVLNLYGIHNQHLEKNTRPFREFLERRSPGLQVLFR